MQNIQNPRWAFLANSLPIFLLLALLYSELSLIHSILDTETKIYWGLMGLGLFALAACNTAYALYRIRHKQLLGSGYAFSLFISCMAMLYYYIFNLESTLFIGVPRWMRSGNTFMYLGTFLMPSLLYALLLLVKIYTPDVLEQKAIKSFGLALAIPLGAFIFTQLGLPWHRVFSGPFFEHFLAISFVSLSVLFLFFLFRFFYILSQSKKASIKKQGLFWLILISIVFPLLGLALNNGHTGDFVFEKNIFGNFSSPWFYIIALANGILLCLPNTESPRFRLYLFLARSIGFAYTFYFFLLFLPFLPLSIVAIVVLGFGFLMLTPLALFYFQVHILIKDYHFLKTHYTTPRLIGGASLAFLLIPLIISFTFLYHKHQLHQALDYIYANNYEEDHPINVKSLETTLNKISNNKIRNNAFFSNRGQPYISPYFNWLVMDNLTLSNNKMRTLEKVFFGNTYIHHRERRERNNPNIHISNITTESKYDEEQGAWLSWVHLELSNASSSSNALYKSSFELMDGCYISDYYLYVGDRKEMGLLTEKKAALWVFNQIRNENRDPGLLNYAGANRIDFRVFPFAAHELRKTGIQFLHKEAFTLKIDGHNIELGDAQLDQTHTATTDKGFHYISTQEKANLSPVKRQPKYHFILDQSVNAMNNSNWYAAQIDAFTQQENINDFDISFCNTYTSNYKANENWQAVLADSSRYQGGFYVERAIKKILYQYHQQPSASYPVIVVLSQQMNQAIIDQGFADFQFSYPEALPFYELNANGQLLSHNLFKQPKAVSDTLSRPLPTPSVLAWPNSRNPQAYIAHDSLPTMIVNTTPVDLKAYQEKPAKNWETGLAMQAHWRQQILHPKTADRNWLELVKSSFSSRILSPLTAYIVVENEAQKNMLLKKQKETLSGKKSLDTQDNRMMSEPSIWLVLILIAFVVIIRKNKGL